MRKSKASVSDRKEVVPDRWVVEELKGAQLGDKRLLKRAQIIMTQFARHPSASIPQACGQWSDIKAAYRFFDNEQVKPEQLLAAHSQATCERLKSHSVVLAVQDTTSLNYSTHPQTEGLGPISNNPDKTIGLLLHTTLALTVSGRPLGLLSAQVHSRDRQSFGKRRNSQQRNRTQMARKESQRWLESLQDCQQVAQACPQTMIVNVADREGDIYELFESARAQANSVHVLVRAQHNRQVEGPEKLLWDYLEAQPVAATVEVQVPRQPGQKSRKATLEIRFGQPTLCAPLLKAGKASQQIWAVQAREINPPAGRAAILWRLLTTLPVNNVAQALEKVRWYCQRWQIEVMHKVLKSGCKIEQRQLETAQRLKRVLMMDLIVAWRVMLLNKAAREEPQSRAADWFLETEWKVLWCYMKQEPAPKNSPSLRQMVRWIGQLGGFIGRKSDGEPGPIVLWRGLIRLHDLATTWSLLKTCG